MQKFLLPIVLGAVFCLPGLTPPSAYALEFSEFGALNFALPNVQDDRNSSQMGTTGNIGPGLGISLGFHLWNRFSVDAGVVYFTRRFSVSGSAAPRFYSMNHVQLPIIIRYGITPTISVGAGPYCSIASGSIGLQTNAQNEVVSYRQLDLNSEDYGIATSARYRIPLNDLIQFVADLRLLVGTSNLDISGKRTFQNRDLQSWLGFSLDL